MSIALSFDASTVITEDPSHPASHIVKKELFDPDIMRSILSDERYPAIDRAKLKKYYKTRLHPNETRVVYNYGKGYETSQLGRLYPDNGLGLQSFGSDIRNPLTAKYYWDIDIENAHYIFAQKLADEKGLKTDIMKYYITNRNECLSKVASNKATAKTAFLKVLYGGDIFLHDIYNTCEDEPDGDLSILIDLKREVNALMDIIWHEREDVRRHCLRKSNPKASVLSVVLQTIERQVLLTLDKYLTEKGRPYDVLIHDGGLIRRLEGETAFPADLLRSAEEFLLSETGYNLHLVNKPIVHNYDLKPEVIYITEGVTVDTFRAVKETFEKKYFYLKVNASICEIQDDHSLLMMSVDHATKNLSNLCFEYRKDNIIKRIPFLPLWMSCPDRREYNDLVFKPDMSQSDKEYNTFIPLRGSLMPHTGGEKGLARFMDITLNLANGNPDHRDYIIKWIALKLQKPWVIPGVCLVFTGPQGVGKSLLWNFVGTKLIGRDQYICTDNILKDIFDKYSEAELSNLCCLMEETSSSLTRKLANSLKAKFTATQTRINPKEVRPYDIDTYMSYVLLTNDATPVKLENDDRRYAIFNTGSDHKGDFSYWTETATLFNDDAVAGTVFAHLMSLDLSDFIVRNYPETELRQIMIDAERPLEEAFLIEFAADSSDNEWRGSNQAFYQIYSHWCNKYEVRAKSAITFGRELTPYILRGWISNSKTNGIHGKIVNLGFIRSS